MSKEVGKGLFYNEEDVTTEGAGHVYLQVPSDKKPKDKEGTSELLVRLEDTRFDNENETAEDVVRADENTLHEDNVEVIHQVATEGNRPPSPQDARLPGAFRVLGPDYVDGEEDVTVISSPSVNSPSSTSAANAAFLAHLVDNDEENRILN
jgi:hypothetical protein